MRPKKPRSEEKQTCLPVTIRSIEVAAARRSGDEVMFFGSEPGMLLVVGVVESVSQQAASVELSLNDSTGRIRIRQFGVEPDGVLTTVEPGKYIMVAGQLRTSPELHMTVMNARVVRSPDEISYHMIEAAHAALKLQRGETDPVMSPAKPQKLAADVSMTQANTETAHVGVPAEAAIASANMSTPNVGDVNAAVLSVLRKEGTDKPEGVAISAVCAHLKSTPESEIRVALNKLVDEGEAYTTVDDDHFALI